MQRKYSLDTNIANQRCSLTCFPGGSDGEESAFSGSDQVQSLGWEDPLENGWQPAPVFLPREFHGQRSLVSYSPCGRKDLDTTK